MILRTGCLFQSWALAQSRPSINVCWMTRYVSRIQLEASCSWGLAPLDRLGLGGQAKNGQRRWWTLENFLIPDSPQLEKTPTGSPAHHSHSGQKQRWPLWGAIEAILGGSRGWTCLGITVLVQHLSRCPVRSEYSLYSNEGKNKWVGIHECCPLCMLSMASPTRDGKDPILSF